MLRKSLSAAIAAIMTFTVLPVGVRAEEETINEESVLSEEQTAAKVETAEHENEERSSEGEAYAVVTDDKDLIFFRSNDTYANKSTGTFTDIKGNEYTGTVFSGIETLNASYYPDIPWYTNSSEIINSKVADGQKIAPVSTAFWFNYFDNLTSLDVSGFDTSNVTNMSHMFAFCYDLSSLDLSGFDTSNVTDMSNMFYECSSLTSLDVSNFDTSNVASMFRMFYSCGNLIHLNVSNFDTSNVTKMNGMFCCCNGLVSLDVSNFDTSNVKDMNWMFLNCTSLTSLDVSGFDTSNVTRMAEMFSECRNLSSLDLSGFDTSNVTDMSNMFDDCHSLTSLDLSGFDTSNVTDMKYMFAFCWDLSSLDLSNFDTSNVTDMHYMFIQCRSLTSLDLSSFDTSKAQYMNDMFFLCDSLNCITLGTKFTKWVDNAYLPKGTWKKGELAKTERELYNEYPSHAQEWTGTWKKAEQKPEFIKLNKTEASLKYGSTLTLEAIIKPYYAENKNVSWESADENIAIVNSNGLVTAKGIGVTTITARTVNNLTVSCTVRVLFTDVADSKQYFYEPVYWAVDNEITVGAGGPGKFSPSASCTREQFVTFLWRLKGQPKAKEGCDLADVSKDAWYYDPISWAAENGITTGLNDGTNRFGVGQACTREQCVTFLHRAAGSPEPEGSIEFTDSPEGRYYYKAIKWAAGKGITVGLNDGTGRFGVGQKCTRGMLVTFLSRYAHAQ